MNYDSKNYLHKSAPQPWGRGGDTFYPIVPSSAICRRSGSLQTFRIEPMFQTKVCCTHSDKFPLSTIRQLNGGPVNGRTSYNKTIHMYVHNYRQLTAEREGSDVTGSGMSSTVFFMVCTSFARNAPRPTLHVS